MAARADLPKVPLDVAASGPKVIEMSATIAERVTFSVGERFVVVGPGFHPEATHDGGSLFAREVMPALRAASA
jgi:hypothetical protein